MPRAALPYVALIVAIGMAVSVVANVQLGLASAALTAAAIVMRGVGRRVTFEFADGFLAFRGRDEWPHGVQEEYDVRYSWPSTARVSPSR